MNRSTLKAVASESSSNVFRQFHQPGAKNVDVGDVFGECRFMRDRFGFSIGDNRTMIDPAREFPEVFSVLTELLLKLLKKIIGI